MATSSHLQYGHGRHHRCRARRRPDSRLAASGWSCDVRHGFGIPDRLDQHRTLERRPVPSFGTTRLTRCENAHSDDDEVRLERSVSFRGFVLSSIGPKLLLPVVCGPDLLTPGLRPGRRQFREETDERSGRGVHMAETSRRLAFAFDTVLRRRGSSGPVGGGDVPRFLMKIPRRSRCTAGQHGRLASGWILCVAAAGPSGPLVVVQSPDCDEFCDRPPIGIWPQKAHRTWSSGWELRACSSGVMFFLWPGERRAGTASRGCSSLSWEPVSARRSRRCP